jgi:secreted Zn-dependent insulinase-like peptidase
MADPDDSPGLARLLEYMLFAGSVKYPKEGEYNEVIVV